MRDSVNVVVEGPRKVVAYVTSRTGFAGHLHDQGQVDDWLARYPRMEAELRPAWDRAVEESGGPGPTMTVSRPRPGEPGDKPTVTVAEALDIAKAHNQHARTGRAAMRRTA